MRSPGADIGQFERLLTPTEIAHLPDTDHVGSMSADFLDLGLVSASEKVSWSTEFGVVYRYDLVQTVEIEGDMIDLRAVLVVWGKSPQLCLATHPIFDLPPDVWAALGH